MTSTSHSSTAVVAGDLPCAGCGYNVRTLRVASRCPECGLEVERTLHDPYSVGGPQWVTGVRRGALLIILTMPVGIALFFICAGLASVLGWQGAAGAALGLTGMAAVGAYGFSRPVEAVRLSRWTSLAVRACFGALALLLVGWLGGLGRGIAYAYVIAFCVCPVFLAAHVLVLAVHVRDRAMTNAAGFVVGIGLLTGLLVAVGAVMLAVPPGRPIAAMCVVVAAFMGPFYFLSAIALVLEFRRSLYPPRGGDAGGD